MIRPWSLILILLAAAPVAADVLETRDGRVLEGTFLGGTQQAVRFQAGDEVHVLLVEEVQTLRFGVPAPARAAKAPSPAPVAPAAATPAAPAVPAQARVPAGTRLRVRLTDGIDARQTAAGDRFAATLDTGLGIDGQPILPAGTKLYGRVAELRATGPVATRVKLELTRLMHQGALVEIVTGPQQLAADEETPPASAANLPVRPGYPTGALLEFRLLQPFDLALP